jgi:hypothetical protein
MVGDGVNPIAGFGASRILCNRIGFCVDKHSVTAAGAQFNGGLMRLEGLEINNGRQNDPAAGALRMEGTQPGVKVSDCILGGGVGLVMMQGTFQGSVRDCTFAGPGRPGTVGIYAGQIEVANVRIQGFDHGIVTAGITTIRALATEAGNVGVLMGENQPNTFRGYIDNNSTPGTYSGNAGSKLTVTQYVYGNFDNDDGSGAGGHGKGIHATDRLNKRVCPLCTAGITITGQDSSNEPGGFNGARGVYSLSASSNVPPQTMQTAFTGQLPAVAASIIGWQTERLNVGLQMDNVNGSTVQNVTFTGGIGPAIGVTTAAHASWSSPNGGTLTFTLDYDSGRSGARVCFTEFFLGSSAAAGYDFNQNTGFPNGVNCQWTGQIVTIRGVDNPAAPISGSIANPGTNSSVGGNVSSIADACIIFGSVDHTTVHSLECGMTANPQLDFSGYGTGVPGRMTIHDFRNRNGIIQPPHSTRGGINIYNSIGLSEADLGILYNDLPGNVASLIGAPSEGEQHLIVDAKASNCSDAACNVGATVTAGTGALHRLVRYNGSVWTVMGQ